MTCSVLEEGGLNKRPQTLYNIKWSKMSRVL